MKLERFITILLTVGVVLAFGWSYTYDTTTPAGTDAPSVIDNRIREVKQALQERLAADHYFALTGTQVSNADAGKHSQITFQNYRTIPSSIDEDEAMLYTKDTSGTSELYFMDESENEIQITSSGYLASSALGPDSVTEYHIQLSNAGAMTALNAAGNGTVNLIAASTDDLCQLSDGAQVSQSTQAADPDKTIVTKDYCDDLVTTETDFGAYTAKTFASTYEAATDGYVTCYAYGSSGSYDAQVRGYTGASSGSLYLRTACNARDTTQSIGLSFPVPEGQYWKVTLTVSDGTTASSALYWMPVGD